MSMRRHGLEIVVLAFAVAAAAACGPAPVRPAADLLDIVITNDDGIEAPGILALAEALRPLGRVTVAAPSGNRSGVSHGVTSDRAFTVTRSLRNGQTWFAIDAFPATCVRLAIEQLLPEKPDLVLSGINRGENLGTVTFYSATVAAAREAAFLEVPAMAVNLVSSENMDYGTAAAVVAEIIRALGPDGIARGAYLNVNIPPLTRDAIRGIRLTRQDTRAPLDHFEKAVAPDGTIEFRPRWEHLEPGEPGTDIWAVRNGYVSVSVFGFDQSAAVPPGVFTALKRLESLRLK
jgi:5'-nucleotidase